MATAASRQHLLQGLHGETVYSPQKRHLFRLLYFFGSVFSSSTGAAARPLHAIFTFGDSTADVGASNFLPISTTMVQAISYFRGNLAAERSRSSPYPRTSGNILFQANFAPYGQDFIPASGRFSNGRLVGDFVAEFMGLKPAPPSLDPHGDFSMGANFASAGATIVDYVIGVAQSVDLRSQLYAFTGLLRQNRRLQKNVSNSLFLISIGSSDFMLFTSMQVQNLTDTVTYVRRLVQAEVKAITILYRKGARYFLVLGVGPIGCAPALTAVLRPPQSRCVESLNTVIEAFNLELRSALSGLINSGKAPGATVMLAETFSLIHKISTDPKPFGFVNGLGPCCGGGQHKTQVACGQRADFNGSVILGRSCRRRADYVWWDQFHLTEGANYLIAASLWSGPLEAVSPINLQQVIESP